MGPATDKISYDEPELMDLPEPIILQIMTYFSHDFLRHTASRVSMEWKRLAHSQVLWSQASLVFQIGNADKSLVESFNRDIQATPYLHKLFVNLGGCKKELEPMQHAIKSALLSTRCRIHELTLSLYEYSSEIMLFLQQHRELRKLELADQASDNVDSAGVAATVGRLAPRLISLDLSRSLLLELPKAGLMLATPPLVHGEDHNLHLTEPEEPRPALDLWNVDEDGSEFVNTTEPQGLLHLTFCSIRFKSTRAHLYINNPSSREGITAKNLSALFLAHKDTLESAYLCHPGQWAALVECRKLEELTAHCDPDGSGLCAMLQNMHPTLRRLTLGVPAALGAQGLTTVLQVVCRHAPRLQVMSLHSLIEEEDSEDPFPSFKLLEALFVGTLRELTLTGVGFVGREHLLELVSIATAEGAQVSLRALHLWESRCSAACRKRECRNETVDALFAALPSLETMEKFLRCNYCH